MKWPDPVADDALTGCVGDFVRFIEPESEADQHAVLFDLLVYLGCVIGNQPHFMTGSSRQTVAEYACIVGNSSRSRKGTARERVLELMKRVAPEFQTNFSRGIATGEGIITRLSDMAKESGDNRLLCFEGEFSKVLHSMKMFPKLSGDLRDAYDGKDIGREIRGKPYSCSSPHLSISGDTTSAELEKVIMDVELMNGFGNRVLWVCVKRSKDLIYGGNPLDELNQAKLNSIVKGLKSAIAFAKKVKRVQFDEKADEIWAPYYHRMMREADTLPKLTQAIEAREEAHITRLALLYSLLDKSSVISTPHITAAIAAWKYCGESARYLFAEREKIGESPQHKILALLAQHPEGLTTTQITFMAFNNNKAADPFLHTLEEAKTIRSERVKSVGRPSIKWFLTVPPPPTNGGGLIQGELIQIESVPEGREAQLRAVGCSVLYVPKHQAWEYAPLATSSYAGCGLQCCYCYNPKKAGQHGVVNMTQEEFDAGATPRKNYLNLLRREAQKYQAAGITDQVLLSFTTDPYNNSDDLSLTRQTIELLQEFGFSFTVLTKGGMNAVMDLDLYRRDRDAFACTLTSLDPVVSKKWEKEAALPADRVKALKTFHKAGIWTWVSLEPVFDPEASLKIVDETHSFVNHYKVGRMNHLELKVDWQSYTERMIEKLAKYSKVSAYVKRDLQPYLPAGYDNPMRVDQHY